MQPVQRRPAFRSLTLAHFALDSLEQRLTALPPSSDVEELLDLVWTYWRDVEAWVLTPPAAGELGELLQRISVLQLMVTDTESSHQA